MNFWKSLFGGSSEGERSQQHDQQAGYYGEPTEGGKAEAWSDRGIALMNLGRHQEALVAFDHALALGSDFSTTWGNKGIALFNLDRPQEALEAFDHALEFDPDFFPALHNKGSVLVINLGRHQEALEVLERTLEIEPDFPQAWGNKGVALLNLNRHQYVKH